METTPELEKILSRAKIGIMQKPDTVFFSTLCSSLETKFSDELPTAGTDGVRLIINPEFFQKLTLDERIFLLAHETLHVAYLHVLRCEHRDKRLFNIAADYVINLELVDRGFSMPKIGLLDTKYKGMSTEQVYKLLEEDSQSMSISLPMQDILDPSSSEGSNNSDTKGNSKEQGEDNPDLSSNSSTAKAKALEAEVQAKISRAIMVAELSQQAGLIPANIKRYFEDLHKPQVNWKVVLQRFINKLTQDDYSWRRPNRKYLPHYLPKLQSSTLSRLDFAIDTSGSITHQQFTQFVSEVHSVLRMLKPKELGVYQFDHILQNSDVVKRALDILTIEFSGGGGTRPQAAINEFIKNKALGLIILTDGHFYKSDLVDPKRPVIWVVYDNPTFIAPFGTVVHFELKNLK